MAAVISPADARGIVGPLLPSLPGAAASTQPATAVLPLLSPILRQRVQFLSISSTEPWIRLLSYEPAKAAKLAEIARHIEPHPISGEIEVDWDSDTEVRYKRIDVETLQALVFVPELELVFRLVYCIDDGEAGKNAWKVGEVSIPDKPSVFSSFGGSASIAEAETAFFKTAQSQGSTAPNSSFQPQTSNHRTSAKEEEEDDDDDYWAQYDATPAGRTPAAQRSPAPRSTNAAQTPSAEDAYYAQYDSVQPAMDPHDPDEAAEQVGIEVSPPLGLSHPSAAPHDSPEESLHGGWTIAQRSSSRNSRHTPEEEERLEKLLHPRPASVNSFSSKASSHVARLEELADRKEQNEFGVKQHVSRSIKSLFLLSRASGIDREEFEQMVKRELDVLGMMES